MTDRTRRMLTPSSTKTYTHANGLSVTFRQHNAKSHCSKLHGYSLQVSLEFRCSHLDSNGWVLDYGSMKPIKAWLENTFDHKLLVAKDDPYVKMIEQLHQIGVADILLVEHTGTEAFATMIYEWVEDWLNINHRNRVFLYKVDVNEHEANRATIRNDAVEYISPDNPLGKPYGLRE